MTEDEKRMAPVLHVVHDYANFVSAADTIPTNPAPPLNTHVQHIYLVNCRKMFDFFRKPSDGVDIVAADFFPFKGKPRFRFPMWNQWGKAMDKQIVHLTYSRVTEPKLWDGYSENALFLAEFRAAWKLFRSKLDEPYESEFVKQVFLRKQPHGNGQPSEFRNLDLD